MTPTARRGGLILRRAGLGLIFVWFLLGGVGHFVWTDGFARAVPDCFPAARLIVLVTGALEILGALALLSGRLRPLAGLALAIFILAVTPVHVDMLVHPERWSAVPVPLLWARLALQPLLAWIAWRVTRPALASAAFDRDKGGL